MIARAMLMLALPAVLAGCALFRGQGVATAQEPPAIRQAAAEATIARRALTKGQWQKAVAHAEIAVAHRADDPTLRALLGTAYLRAGRFASAAQAFDDTLALHPGDGRAALNLALAQIALGDRARAQAVLTQHADAIAPTDRGLALALAGKPHEAVAVLLAAMHATGADARMRQNLALALALAGEWRDAHMMVGLDLDPLATNRRILEWMQFARPHAASDQVAALLHITPMRDPGQPATLALAPPPPAPVQAAAASIDRFIPAAPTAPVAPPVESAAAPRPTPGKWFVQLGAFESAAVARDGWSRTLRRLPALAAAPPSLVPPARGSRFYRLSVGGFAQADAAALCRTLRGQGGGCYVRAAEGDRRATWSRAPQIAAR